MSVSWDCQLVCFTFFALVLLPAFISVFSFCRQAKYMWNLFPFYSIRFQFLGNISVDFIIESYFVFSCEFWREKKIAPYNLYGMEHYACSRSNAYKLSCCRINVWMSICYVVLVPHKYIKMRSKRWMHGKTMTKENYRWKAIVVAWFHIIMSLEFSLDVILNNGHIFVFNSFAEHFRNMGNTNTAPMNIIRNQQSDRAKENERERASSFMPPRAPFAASRVWR